jgi:hypothetical protein
MSRAVNPANMALPQDLLDELKATFPGIATVEEGGLTYVVFEQLTLPANCSPAAVRALLCPGPRDGYPSRLFLSQKIKHTGPGQNWNAAGVVILGERWWAVSWKINVTNHTLINMVGCHLEAFRG